MSQIQHKILLTTGDYAARLDIDYRALTKAVRTKAITPLGELPSGRFVFDSENLASDAQVAAALRRK